MLSLIIMLGIFFFLLGVGYFLVCRVPSLLHTPLMSATNAISAITILGAFILFSEDISPLITALVSVAIISAAFKGIGAFVLTDRMFKMFRKKK